MEPPSTSKFPKQAFDAAELTHSASPDGRLLNASVRVAISATMGATSLVLLGATRSPFYSVALLCLLAAGLYSSFGPFWALPSEFLTGYSAAAGIALINS